MIKISTEAGTPVVPIAEPQSSSENIMKSTDLKLSLDTSLTGSPISRAQAVLVSPTSRPHPLPVSLPCGTNLVSVSPVFPVDPIWSLDPLPVEPISSLYLPGPHHRACRRALGRELGLAVNTAALRPAQPYGICLSLLPGTPTTIHLSLYHVPPHTSPSILPPHICPSIHVPLHTCPSILVPSTH